MKFWQLAQRSMQKYELMKSHLCFTKEMHQILVNVCIFGAFVVEHYPRKFVPEPPHDSKHADRFQEVIIIYTVRGGKNQRGLVNFQLLGRGWGMQLFGQRGVSNILAHLCLCTFDSYALLSVSPSVTGPKFRLENNSYARKYIGYCYMRSCVNLSKFRVMRVICKSQDWLAANIKLHFYHHFIIFCLCVCLHIFLRCSSQVI